ncbi:hypothetical protein KDX23_07435 [Burkholderia vietnamiensis]|uniref:hypothetical protein n=1 Tax=Burkholderia vietnamiensis TaxID=60552 RepID=UPI001B978780|nr:hypothetical protein [Burkholderia vietnamiensis]MBR8082576.1 hypothetical protein [Burkholderia vietnamiensis]
MPEVIGIIVGILTAASLRPFTQKTFAINVLTAVTTVVVVAYLPIQGAIVDLVVALVLWLVLAQLINGSTERAQP